MKSAIAEQRRETRRAAHGAVLVRWDNPGPVTVKGKLVDVSDNGFRMAHQCATLLAGQAVEFEHPEARGQARAVWTRILGDKVETGFVVTA